MKICVYIRTTDLKKNWKACCYCCCCCYVYGWFLLVADSRSKLSKTVISVLNRGMPEFLVDVDLQGYNLYYLEKHRSSLVCRIHGMLLQILS